MADALNGVAALGRLPAPGAAPRTNGGGASADGGKQTCFAFRDSSWCIQSGTFRWMHVGSDAPVLTGPPELPHCVQLVEVSSVVNDLTEPSDGELVGRALPIHGGCFHKFQELSHLLSPSAMHRGSQADVGLVSATIDDLIAMLSENGWSKQRRLDMADENAELKQSVPKRAAPASTPSVMHDLSHLGEADKAAVLAALGSPADYDTCVVFRSTQGAAKVLPLQQGATRRLGERAAHVQMAPQSLLRPFAAPQARSASNAGGGAPAEAALARAPKPAGAAAPAGPAAPAAHAAEEGGSGAEAATPCRKLLTHIRAEMDAMKPSQALVPWSADLHLDAQPIVALKGPCSLGVSGQVQGHPENIIDKLSVEVIQLAARASIDILKSLAEVARPCASLHLLLRSRRVEMKAEGHQPI
ncbi:unnamed protein product, partial [Prorocentrum cordatum]